jgi:MFS family permease
MPLYSNTGRVMASSLIAVCSSVPYIAVSLLGGTVADNMNKKKIMLICDAIAAIGSLVIFLCCCLNILQIWILCIINMISGLMNAFQNPASQVVVTLLIDKEDYSRVGGIQSALGAGVGILNPILASALFGFGGLQLVISIDLITFIFAFFTLLIFIRIPDNINEDKKTSIKELSKGMREGVLFIKQQKSILFLLVMYSFLEFVGAISFDSMYSPFLLARTGNNETVVGIVSTVAAVGSLLACTIMSVSKQSKNKLSAMFGGSIMCLCGIMLFGAGRSVLWWCVVVFLGCFGSPIYQTYQTVILRENVPVSMQGRIFSMQGMITQSLTPMGYLIGAALADYVFEPFMKKSGVIQNVCSIIVGTGNGAGMGLMFVIAGLIGIVIIVCLMNNQNIRVLGKRDK